jgi:hypothetical protein
MQFKQKEKLTTRSMSVSYLYRHTKDHNLSVRNNVKYVAKLEKTERNILRKRRECHKRGHFSYHIAVQIVVNSNRLVKIILKEVSHIRI